MNVRIDAPNRTTSKAAAARTRAEWVTASVLLVCAVVVFRTRVGAGAPGFSDAAALAAFGLLTGITVSLSVASWRDRLRQAFARPLARVLVVPLAIDLVLVAYSGVAGLPIAPRAAAYTPYLILPALIIGAPAGSSPRPVQVLLAALCLWLPIEFKLLPPVPLPATGGLPAAQFAALANGLYLFLVARPVDRIGYTFLLSRRDIVLALLATGAFAIPGIPIGLGTHFLTWHPHVTAATAAIAPFAIYLATAVPEEFLFRGLIQNSLEHLLGRAGLPVAAVVFGLAHFPGPRYMLLATLAGFAYGWVYIHTRRITASAVTHALVDWIWVLLFRVR